MKVSVVTIMVDVTNALTFTSVVVDINDHAIQGSGPASFHLMNALIPAEGVQPSYAQLYIYDSQEANERCVQCNPLFNPGILLDLSITLSISHLYAEVYRQAYEVMRVSYFILHFYLIFMYFIILSYRPSLQRSIQMFACKFIYSGALMQDNTIFPLLMR